MESPSAPAPPAASPPEPTEVGQLLSHIRAGKPGAFNQLFDLLYRELRGEAHLRLAFRRGGHSLSTTALVHETYLKLLGARSKDWQDRGHFFAVAARAMRQILVDAARRHQAEKRGGGQVITAFEDNQLGVEAHLDEVLAVDGALDRLQAFDDRLAQMVELRFFAGLSVEETAASMDLSVRTVKRDWRKARAFLYHLLAEGNPGPAEGPP